MRVADDKVDARQSCDLFRSALRVTAGDDDSGFRILPADSANRGAGVLIGACCYGAGVQDYNGGLRRTRGADEPTLFELPFEGGAIGLGGAATEVFYKESGHMSILAHRQPCGLWLALAAVRNRSLRGSVLVHRGEYRTEEVGRGLNSLQMRVAEASVIIQSDRKKLVVALQ